MAFSDKQREALISELGEPKLTIEFDVWGESKVSMWTHFDHSEDYQDVKKRFLYKSGYLKLISLEIFLRYYLHPIARRINLSILKHFKPVNQLPERLLQEHY